MIIRFQIETNFISTLFFNSTNKLKRPSIPEKPLHSF